MRVFKNFIKFQIAMAKKINNPLKVYANNILSPRNPN